MSELTPDQLPAPWHPMTNARDIKTLGKLGEEAGELATVACRAIIQGIEEINPETGMTNREWLTKEIADVRANSRMAIERFGLDEEAIDARANRKYDFQTIWHSQI